MDSCDSTSSRAVGATDGDKGKKDLEYKAKAEASKSAWTKPNAQVGEKSASASCTLDIRAWQIKQSSSISAF